MPIDAVIVRGHPCGPIGHDRKPLNLVQDMANCRKMVGNEVPNLLLRHNRQRLPELCGHQSPNRNPVNHPDRGRTADLIVPFDHINATRVGRDFGQTDQSGGRIGLRIQRRRSSSPLRPRKPRRAVRCPPPWRGRRRDRARAGGRQRAWSGADGGTPEDRPRGPARLRAGDRLLTMLAFRSTRQFGPVGQVRG